jgi:hypothetical protein
MPLQFRRGHSDDLPLPSDAAVGEPLFTTNDGKLHIKKADGTFAEIGDGSASAIDLSGLATGSLVQVNTTQDGFDAATQIPSAVTFATADGTGFSNAVEARLLDELPTDGGVLDIAQQSTLVELGTDIDAIDTRVTALENAPDGVDLTGFSDGDVLMVDAGSGGNTLAAAVAGTDYIAPSDIAKLRAVFTEASLPANAGTTTGYLKWAYESGSGTWSVEAAVADAPAFINGGNALADVGN